MREASDHIGPAHGKHCEQDVVLRHLASILDAANETARDSDADDDADVCEPIIVTYKLLRRLVIVNESSHKSREDELEGHN